MGLFSAIYRLKNRHAKSASQVLREKNYLTEIGVADSSQDEKMILETSKSLYQGMFVNFLARYKEDLEEFDKLLEKIDTNERAIVEYLKSEIWNYEKRLDEAVDKYISHAKRIMKDIGN